MKPNILQLKKWIAALDSGEYKQGQLQLQDGFGYCCLGVACKVLIPNASLWTSDEGRIRGTVPKSQPASPAWLIEINLDFDKKTGVLLSSLNDSGDYTFPEIATLLELVYIHKMLD